MWSTLQHCSQLSDFCPFLPVLALLSLLPVNLRPSLYLYNPLYVYIPRPSTTGFRVSSFRIPPPSPEGEGGYAFLSLYPPPPTITRTSNFPLDGPISIDRLIFMCWIIFIETVKYYIVCILIFIVQLYLQYCQLQ